MVRLQKFLAECGIASRRKSEVLITTGRIQVNGKVVKELGSKVDPEKDKVYFDGKIVNKKPKGLILLHKPKAYISTKYDPEERRIVMDLLPRHYSAFSPVGRLDYNTTGLLLLTNDGELSQSLAHPKHEIQRVYRCKVKGKFTENNIKKLRGGLNVEDSFVTLKARITREDPDSTSLELILTEGRNRVIRNIMQSMNYPILSLKRIEFGPFRLGKLKLGEYKFLSEKEYTQLISSNLPK
ncbi:UNVERIFIED_CONTAM: hypothetical protein GTU68_053382 [Idotea baltica]|nr:hypothetical protein [Idotea baltica]